jgi:MFS family permease
MTLVILFLVNVLNFYDRFTLGAAAEPIRREFHLTDARLGLLTTAFTIIYALAGLPLGRLADVRSRKGILAGGVALWSGLTALGGLASSYAFLMFTRLGVGIGEASCAPAATSWIGDIVKPERRTRALAWFMMAVPVGSMLSYALVGPAAQAFGWRGALALAAAPAVALIPALLVLDEPARSTARRTARGESPGMTLAGMAVFWWIALSGAVLNFAMYSFSAFFPALLTRFHHLSVARAGVWAGIGTGVAGITGALCAGFLGDRVRADFARSRLRIASIASLAASPLAFAAIASPGGSAVMTIALMMPAYGLLQMYYGLTYAALQDVVAPGLRGAAMGAYFVVQYLGGAAWGPLAIGALSDRFARAAFAAGASVEGARSSGLHQAMFAIPALALLLSAVLWVAGEASSSAAGATSHTPSKSAK